MTLLRRHGVFLGLLVCGLVLRVLVQWTYGSAFLFYDSQRYLDNVHELDPGGEGPLGYTVFIRGVLGVLPDLAVLAAVNHLLGLGMAVLIYAVLLRRGVRPWLAALAAAPVLLDAYQLVIEHMVMSDVLFQFLVVVGVALLLWRGRPDPVTAAAAGLVFGAAALTRDVGHGLVLAGLLFCLLAAGHGRRRLAVGLLHVVAFTLPLLGFAAYHAHVYGDFTVPSEPAARRLYARAAVVAHCDTLPLPPHERVLCPPPGVVEPRAGSLIEGYTYGDTNPVDDLQPPPGESVASVLNDFTLRVVRHQPLDMATAVGDTFFRPFLGWSRVRHDGELPIERWRFQDRFPVFGPETDRLVAEWGGGEPSADPEVGRALRTYQQTGGYLPGPVLLACLALGLAGAAGVGRARASGQRAACLLWVTVGGGLLLAADLYLFSWRYQLPALVTLPPAAALGLSALLSRGPPPPGSDSMPVVSTVRFRPAEASDVERDALADFRATHQGASLGPVVVVIPAYDEAESIGEVLDALAGEYQGLGVDVLVMSDGSTDETVERARAHGAHVCAFASNVGQGVVLRHGYGLAHEYGARYVVTTDADGQYDAADIPSVLEPVVRGEADFVIGSRRLGRAETDDAVRHLGVRVFAGLVGLLTGRRLTDTSSGLRAFTAEMGVDVRLTQPQYQTSELLIGALARGYRVVERPSVMRKRAAGASKKGANAIYGLRYARVIVGTWLREWPGRRRHPRVAARRQSAR
ncbi:MAG: glycosyltransferase family 2 protein [Actinomycetes bacterium]